MVVRFCRDCANFEDRRDIDGIALCAKNIGPYLCCEEFESRDVSINENRLYYRFCSECTHFQDINGALLCAKNHSLEVACEEFVDRFEKLNVIRQNNHVKTALSVHAIKSTSNPDPIPISLIEIGRKIRW